MSDASASHSGVRKPQARGRATRARLLEAARDLFTRQGFEGTSIGDVAQKAGIGVGTVYHHFPDKRTLLLELLDDWAARMEGDDRSDAEWGRFLGDEPAAAIQRWLRESYERLRHRPSIYLVALAVAGRDPEVAARYRRVEELAIRRFHDVIRVGQERGFMRPEVGVDAAAFLVHHTLDVVATQLLVQRVPEEGGVDAADVVAALGDMICRFLLVPALLAPAEPRAGG